jgi:hypothetical protein
VIFTPPQMTPRELQAEVPRGHARFYSSRRWLKRLPALRYAELLVYSWGWWYARRWPRDRSNCVNMRMLAWHTDHVQRTHTRRSFEVGSSAPARVARQRWCKARANESGGLSEAGDY